MNIHKKSLISICVALAVSGHAYAQEPQSPVEEVTVTGVRNAELNAREEERGKNIFSSVISQDDAGSFADQNVAESLQRLPGITLQKSEGEGKFVSVRGLGPGFVSVSMNGNEMASASSDTRAFALDAVSSDLLSSIEVFKSLTPDMDLNSIGGAVNVKTVSAFDRPKDSLRVSGQMAYQAYSEDVSPKISLQGTNKFADDTIGVGYSLSYEKRHTDVYEMRHHANEELAYRQKQLVPTRNGGVAEGPIMLTPYQFEAREEQAERERLGGSFDLGFRPNENNEFHVRYSYTSMEDLDIALREYARFDTATMAEGEVAYIDTATNTFGVTDAELQQQFFIQKGDATTHAFDIGGKSIFNDTWTLDYSYAHSKGDYSKPDGRRVQFRVQDLAMLGRADKDYLAYQIVSRSEMAELAGVSASSLINAGSSYAPANMTYDNIFIEDSFRTDILDQYSANLRKDIDNGFVNYIKVGFSIKERERDRNKDRWSVALGNFPESCAGDLTCEGLRNATLNMFETHTVKHPDFQYPIITQSEAERLLAATSKAAKWTDINNTGQESRKEDYTLTEDTQAAYIMTELQFSEKSSLITGVRYENTDFSSDGYLAIRNDRFLEESIQTKANMDIAVPLAKSKHSYDNFFPSAHYRYEVSDDTLFRASLWTSFTRPGFDQARAYGEIVGRVSLCNPGTLICNDEPHTPESGGSVNDNGQIVTSDGKLFLLAPSNTFRIGNPELEAMTSTNFDASLSWYGDNGDHWQIATFYKDIDNFIVDVRGTSLSFDNMPIDFPIEQITQFEVNGDTVIDNMNMAINGDKAKVYGVELSYSKYFDNGFFVQSNMTLMNSDAKVGDSVRKGSIQLPDQADQTINVSVGWEKDEISARLIANHRSKVLYRIGACTADDVVADQAAGLPTNCRDWADIFQDASSTLDFKATYELNKAIKFTFDVTNLTDQKDLYYFQGNEYSNGKVLFASEDYGRTYLLGASYKFK